jgi:molybdopterin converting factor small subunit
VPKIRIEVFPWLTDFFIPRPQGRLTWDEEIGRTITLRELVAQLEARNPAFVKSIYDRQADTILSHVNVIVNDDMVDMVTALDQPIRDGDCVVFVPGFSGGGR